MRDRPQSYPYSDVQLKEIRDAFKAINSDHGAVSVMEYKVLVATARTISMFSPEDRDTIVEAKKLIEAAILLKDASEYWGDLQGYGEGINDPIYHPLRSEAVVLGPRLGNVARFFANKISFYEENSPYLQKRTKGPNWRLQKFFGDIVQIWTKAGGIVDQGAKYERFFKAVAEPILTDDKAFSNGESFRSEFGGNYNTTTFKNHVEAYMRENNIVGKRGKPRSSTIA